MKIRCSYIELDHTTRERGEGDRERWRKEGRGRERERERGREVSDRAVNRNF